MELTYIKPSESLINDAVRQLMKYQKKEDLPILTRYTHLNENCLGGLTPGTIIVIAGISGSGKTHILQEIEEDIFNPEFNPHHSDTILLRCNWEMAVFKLYLRRLKRGLHMPIKDILNGNIKGIEDDLKRLTNQERNKNIYYQETTLTPDVWYKEVKTFLTLHEDKKRVVITIDHLALVKDRNNNKKKSMDDLIEYINDLKKEFKNVIFILISQLNREIEGRLNPREMAPKRSDLYNTDTLFQISDIVLVIHNPFKLGIEKYMVVNPQYYSHLSDFLDNTEVRSTNFITKGNIFFHYLKLREVDDITKTQEIAVEKIKYYNGEKLIKNYIKLKIL